jgi:hypothetical protein
VLYADEWIETLVEIMRGQPRKVVVPVHTQDPKTGKDVVTDEIRYIVPSDHVRLGAVVEMLNRGFGRPQQSIEVLGQSHLDIDVKLTPEQVEAEIKRRGYGPVLKMIAGQDYTGKKKKKMPLEQVIEVQQEPSRIKELNLIGTTYFAAHAPVRFSIFRALHAS